MTTPEAVLAAAIGGAAWGYDFRDADATKTGRGLAPETLRLLHDAGYALTPLAPEVPPRRDGLRRLESDALWRVEHPTASTLAQAVLGAIEADYRASLDEIRAALAATRTPEPPDSGAWPSIDELRRMTADEANAFFAAQGVDWRVRAEPPDSDLQDSERVETVYRCYCGGFDPDNEGTCRTCGGTKRGKPILTEPPDSGDGAAPPDGCNCGVDYGAQTCPVHFPAARLRSGSPAPEGGE